MATAADDDDYPALATVQLPAIYSYKQVSIRNKNEKKLTVSLLGSKHFFLRYDQFDTIPVFHHHSVNNRQ